MLPPDTFAQAAAGIAGRLRESVADLSCPLDPSGRPLTVAVSIGVATAVPP